MEIATTIWLLIKWLVLIALTAGLLIGLIALFHPLRFNLRLRSTLRGQRAEFWFIYLFRVFKIGIVASPHTQDIVLQIFFWQKILKRNQKTKPQKVVPSSSDFPADFPKDLSNNSLSHSVKDASNNEPSSLQIDDLPKSLAEQKQDVLELPPEKPKFPNQEKDMLQNTETTLADQTTEKCIVKTVKMPTPESASKQASPVEKISQPAFQVSGAEERATVEPIQAEPLAEKKPTTSEKIETIDPFSQKTDFNKDSFKKSTSKHQSISESDNWRKRLRQLRKQIAEKYRQWKKWLRLFSRKYKLLSPIFWKFYQRLRKGFRIDSPVLLCRYALHEPYLTGICQGNLAIFSDMLLRFGINFVPVPVFTGPTFYAKAKVSLVLMPWRLVFAIFALFFEKVLWQEAWKLFKWYRARKTVYTT